eukprot:gnl/TRDRNA2_/TRDRNA2_160093_c0_seq1.p1 gnl/TRDRNA2_/TRDRNA2_160093_c0~~gnl/TRDRNA2_/TRDRNA2_160093_c0_seq1.p1  ORF type:complete len:267 (+),score=18.36 gnl/TRDRNA2_/TRDRNA2_160093_c0_seq1:53-802(+)
MSMAAASPGDSKDKRALSTPREKGEPTLLSLSHIKCSPKWSFNGRHAPPPQAHSVPGPGAYSVDSNAETTSKFSKSPRFGFGVANRDAGDKSRSRVPGPGAYNHRKHIGGEGLAFSLTPRRRPPTQKDIESFPGPGSHDVKLGLGGGPKYTVAQRRDDSARKGAGPGPGEYDHTFTAVVENQPQWGFGTAQRPDTASSMRAATPGPGAYTNFSGIGGGPKYSMQARRTGPRPTMTPGPGAHGGMYSTFG